MGLTLFKTSWIITSSRLITPHISNPLQDVKISFTLAVTAVSCNCKTSMTCINFISTFFVLPKVCKAKTWALPAILGLRMSPLRCHTRWCGEAYLDVSGSVWPFYRAEDTWVSMFFRCSVGRGWRWRIVRFTEGSGCGLGMLLPSAPVPLHPSTTARLSSGTTTQLIVKA